MENLKLHSIIHSDVITLNRIELKYFHLGQTINRIQENMKSSKIIDRLNSIEFKFTLELCVLILNIMK